MLPHYLRCYVYNVNRIHSVVLWNPTILLKMDLEVFSSFCHISTFLDYILMFQTNLVLLQCLDNFISKSQQVTKDTNFCVQRKYFAEFTINYFPFHSQYHSLQTHDFGDGYKSSFQLVLLFGLYFSICKEHLYHVASM